ncbi:MAG: hypothetical protein AAB393_04635 [Bacteroidota bacterium]
MAAFRPTRELLVSTELEIDWLNVSQPFVLAELGRKELLPGERGECAA